MSNQDVSGFENITCGCCFTTQLCCGQHSGLVGKLLWVQFPLSVFLSFYQKFQKTKVRLMGRSGCPYLPLVHFFPLFSAFFSFLGSVRTIQTVTFSACMLLKRQSSISAAVGWPFLPDAVNPPFLPVGWQSGITYPIREEAVINHIFISFRLPPSSLEMSLSLTLKADLLWNQTHISPIPSWLAFERGE